MACGADELGAAEALAWGPIGPHPAAYLYWPSGARFYPSLTYDGDNPNAVWEPDGRSVVVLPSIVRRPPLWSEEPSPEVLEL